MSEQALQRLRREPPPFRRVEVRRTDRRSPRLVRIVLGGPELEGFEIGAPASSVRLLVPPPGSAELVMPTWTGNQFELADGSRAPIRTLTPRHADPAADELTVEVVVAHAGLVADWAVAAAPGDPAAVSGPGRADDLLGATSYLLVGDETAIPAISQLLEALPPDASVVVHVEVGDADGVLDLPAHPGADVNWTVTPPGEPPGVTFVGALPDQLPEKVWIAGEAAAVQAVRTVLFDERSLPRSRAIVRGYWKLGRSAT